MTWRSAFANGGGCRIQVFVHGDTDAAYDETLFASQTATFADPDNPDNEGYYLSVDADGLVTLVALDGVGGTPDEWVADIQPVASLAAGAALGTVTSAYELTTRADGIDLDSLEEASPYFLPNPYVYATAPSTSIGLDIQWSGT